MQHHPSPITCPPSLAALRLRASGVEGHLAAMRDHVLRRIEEAGAGDDVRRAAERDLRVLDEAWTAARGTEAGAS